jgi:hypothetical protein
LNQDTLAAFNDILAGCRSLFERKTRDYGTAWQVLRSPSLTDQIYIKAARIRSIEEKGAQRVSDSVRDEYVGMINYCIMALIQLEGKVRSETPTLLLEEALALYDAQVDITRQLLADKNHDYGEAWRDMRVQSFTDLILMKLLRIKQIEDNDGKTLVSEGVDAGYRDIINYSVFALIKLS